jgi:hypothetical protein
VHSNRYLLELNHRSIIIRNVPNFSSSDLSKKNCRLVKSWLKSLALRMMMTEDVVVVHCAPWWGGEGIGPECCNQTKRVGGG